MYLKLGCMFFRPVFLFMSSPLVDYPSVLCVLSSCAHEAKLPPWGAFTDMWRDPDKALVLSAFLVPPNYSLYTCSTNIDSKRMLSEPGAQIDTRSASMKDDAPCDLVACLLYYSAKVSGMTTIFVQLSNRRTLTCTRNAYQGNVRHYRLHSLNTLPHTCLLTKPTPGRALI